MRLDDVQLDQPIRLDRAWIERHIPHQGGMCLLEEVISWDEERIRCRSVSHRAPDNPLRAHGQLGVACGIEYAAQAMALHGALTGGELATGALATGALATGSLVAGSLVVGSLVVGASPARPPGAGFGVKPAAGMLAALRDVAFHVLRLDDLPGDLLCGAWRVAGDAATALYEFELGCAGACLVHGRATVLLQAESRMHP